jgi:hypothetical protein
MTKAEANESTRALLAHAQVMLTEATETMKRLSAQLAQAQTALELLTPLLDGEPDDEEVTP